MQRTILLDVVVAEEVILVKLLAIEVEDRNRWVGGDLPQDPQHALVDAKGVRLLGLKFLLLLYIEADAGLTIVLVVLALLRLRRGLLLLLSGVLDLQFLLLFLLLALDLNRDILDVLVNAPYLRNKDVVVVRLEQVLDRPDKLLLQRELLLYVRDLPRQIRLVALLTIGWLSVDQLRLHSRQFRRIELLLRGGREPELLLLIGIRCLPR
mmetsp:Transcript_129957/g.417126  ORF Transcript_129957/g.417126 Transcript_129957/m.417126 type:complete len:209 (-) Transcript_129957:919-1545(-)